MPGMDGAELLTRCGTGGPRPSGSSSRASEQEVLLRTVLPAHSISETVEPEYSERRSNAFWPTGRCSAAPIFSGWSPGSRCCRPSPGLRAGDGGIRSETRSLRRLREGDREDIGMSAKGVEAAELAFYGLRYPARPPARVNLSAWRRSDRCPHDHRILAFDEMPVPARGLFDAIAQSTA